METFVSSSPLLDVRAHDVDVVVAGPRVGAVRLHQRQGKGMTMK